MNGRRTDAEESLVRITDLAGRARGTGFLADDCGTLITSHEAVDGLARLVLHAPGELTCVVGADSVVALPEYDLALVRTEGLTVPPLPVAAAERIESGKDVRLRAGRWHSGRIIGDVPVTYTATDRFHLLGTALELSLSGRSALRLGEEATGGPVFDAGTGAVLAVLGTALQADRRAAGFAIPLRAAALAAPGGPLAELLHRNSATVPAFGPDLNLAGALQLTATALGSVVTPRVWRDPVERPEIEREFARFLDGPPGEAGDGALVLGLVGDPGTGRTTELGALAARRARGAEPAPTIWLRGADLRAGDESLRDALARALAAAGRIVTASAGPGGTFGDTSTATPEATAELARSMGRPLLVLLDGPEEMPPVLAHALPAWTSATVHWLRRTATRLIVACRPEHWEIAGTLFPEGTLHRAGGPCAPPPAGPRALPPCSRLPRLAPGQAAEVRASYGIPPDAIAPDDAAHPLALRLLAEVRAALPDGTEGTGGTGEAAPDRWEVFSAYLDLVCLRIAVRLAAARRPQLRGPAVRRLAARVAGQVHEAARRCLGPGQGELEREAFEELFPWRTGWASAVLTEGLLVPAGTGYRFAHEEFADWLQGTHLDLDAALHALVHRWYEPEGPPAEAAVRLPSRAGAGPMPAPGGHVPPPPGSGKAAARAAAGKNRRKRGAAPAEPRPLPVPRHRIGPVLQSMLLLARRSGPTELSRRLSALVHAVETLSQRTADAEAKEEGAGRRLGDPSWWAAHLLGETLLRVPDATPYLGVLRLLAERTTARSVAVGGFDSEAAATLGGLAEFGPWFWLRLPLALADRLELLRILLPADAPPPGSLPPPRRAELDAADAEPPAGAGAGDRRGPGVPGQRAGTDGARPVRDGGAEARGGADAEVGEPWTRSPEDTTAAPGRAESGPDTSDGRGDRIEGAPAAADGRGGRVQDATGAPGGRAAEAPDGPGTAGADLGWFGRRDGRAESDDAATVGRAAEPQGEPGAPAGRGPGAEGDLGWFGARDGRAEGASGTTGSRDGRAEGVLGATGVRAGRAQGAAGPSAGQGPDAQGEPGAPAGRGAGAEGDVGWFGSRDGRAAGRPGAAGSDGRAEGAPAATGGRGGRVQGTAGASGRQDAEGAAGASGRQDAGARRPPVVGRRGPGVSYSSARPEGYEPHAPSDPHGFAGPDEDELPPGPQEHDEPDAGAEGGSAAAVHAADRFLTAVAALLIDDPYGAQPLLCRWFGDNRFLQVPPDGDGMRPTVATAAQALLHTHRRRAIDDLAEALVDAGHPRADELLAALAEDEPSALCRAVDRWAHDDRVERHVAAAAYGLKTAPHVVTAADRELLRFSALALLARPAEGALHGTALALLVRDPETRGKYLPQALARFSQGDPHLPSAVLAPALASHADAVLDAFRARLHEPGEGPGEVLRTLAEVREPVLARRVAALVREHVEHRPEGAENAAAFVDRRLEHGPGARAVLFPLVAALLQSGTPPVRRALAPVLADPGTPVSRPLRQELLEVLMEREEYGPYGPYEREVTVLDALLRAVAAGAAERTEARTRDLVHRTGLLMARTPEGAAFFDRRLIQLAREIPAFGDQVRGWLKSAPAQWAVVVGPSARIRLTAGREKGGEGGSGDARDGADPAHAKAGAPADAGGREPAWHS